MVDGEYLGSVSFPEPVALRQSSQQLQTHMYASSKNDTLTMLILATNCSYNIRHCAEAVADRETRDPRKIADLQKDCGSFVEEKLRPLQN